MPHPLARYQGFLRSIRGQLILLGGAYAGSIVLAVVAIALRTVFFQSHCREKFSPLSEPQRQIATSYAGDNPRPTPPKLEGWTDRDFDSLYGAILDQSLADSDGRWRALLARQYRPRLLERIRGTLVVGNRTQRLTALSWLLEVQPLEPERTQLLDLLAFAQERASRRGETDVVERCQQVIEFVSSNRGTS